MGQPGRRRRRRPGRAAGGSLWGVALLRAPRVPPLRGRGSGRVSALVLAALARLPITMEAAAEAADTAGRWGRTVVESRQHRQHRHRRHRWHRRGGAALVCESGGRGLNRANQLTGGLLCWLGCLCGRSRLTDLRHGQEWMARLLQLSRRGAQGYIPEVLLCLRQRLRHTGIRMYVCTVRMYICTYVHTHRTKVHTVLYTTAYLYGTPTSRS